MKFPGKNPVHKMAKAKKKAEPKNPDWLVAFLKCSECGSRLVRVPTRDYVACATPGHGKLIPNDEIEKLVVREMWRIIETQEAKSPA